MERSLILVKPDAFERDLTGEIIARFERKGLSLVALKLMTMTRELAERHYAEHVGKSFFEELVTFITRSPALFLVVQGPPDTWRIVRSLMGATNPMDALPGTIRGDLATEVTENLVHGSDGAESAEREIALFFPDLVGTGVRR